MTMPQALQKAIARLTSLVEGRYRRAGAGTLPGLNQLAGELGVSRVTAHRAVASLVKKGVLWTRPGAGTYVVGADTDSPPVSNKPASPSRKQLIRHSIEQDILVGTFAAGSYLPSVKELCARYGTSYRTLRSVLLEMQEDRVVRYSSRRLQVVGPANNLPFSKTVVLILRGNSFGIPLPIMPRTVEFLRSLQHQCWKRQLNLEIISIHMRNRDFVVHSALNRYAGKGRCRGEVLGFLIWNASLDAFDMHPLLTRLTRTGNPVAVLDKNGRFGRQTEGINSRLIRGFTQTVSPTAGRLVARHLIAAGHRRIAYLSLQSNTPWSRKRLEGLRRAFDQAGFPNGVREAVRHDAQARVAGDEALDRSASPLIAAFDESLRKTGLTPTRQDREFVPLTYHWTTFAAEMYRLAVLPQAVRPLAQELLSDKEITAWVCANDEIARVCLDFLKKKRVAVPRQIAVVGFDDTPQALGLQLTSYNFNVPDTAAAMLSFVLNPSLPVHRSRHPGIVEIEGMVVRRLTG